MPTRTRIDLSVAPGPDLTEVAQFGGTTVYAESQRVFNQSYSAYMSVLNEELSARLLSTRSALFNAIDLKLWPCPERKLHQAMLGAFLRLGHGDAVGCTSSNRNYYTTLIHADRIGELTKLVALMRLEILRDGRITFKRVTELGSNEGTGFAIHAMAHVAYLGHADYHDRWTVGKPLSAS